MTIYQKLAKIQTKFKSKKSRFNSFGKYYFRSAEDILEAIKPFNDELGIAVTINEELIATDPMPIIQSTARLTDDKGMELTAVAIVGVDLNQKGMQTPQQFGSASSYAKKYALGNLLLIDDTQDSDATNNHGKVTSKATTKQKLTDVTKAINYIKSGGLIDAVTAKYDLTAAQKKTLLDVENKVAVKNAEATS
jgi:hypothetical protein|tara:strand:+ start:6159 stop:6737 length:579 start_codon:yes stop_codon:yes gene_type:complete